MGDYIGPPILVSILLLLLDLVSFNIQAGVDGLHIRQTFYDSPSSDDYSAASNVGLDLQGRGRSYDAGDYEDAGEGGYQDAEDGSEKQGSYALEAADNDAHAGYQSSEPRSSHRDNYEPVYHRKSKSPRGHSGGYNDEDDDDDDHGRYGYQEKKKKKKKIRPKVIIVKKIIPLSTTTAVNVM